MSSIKFSIFAFLLLFAFLATDCRTYHSVTPVDGNKLYITTTGPIFWHRNVAVCDDDGERLVCQDVNVVRN